MRINYTRGISMGQITDVGLALPHDVLWNRCRDRRVQVTRQVTGALRRPQCGIRAQSGTSSKGAAYRLATARQPPAGSDLEPACLKIAGGVPRDLASKPATSRPDKESWDFDGNEQDFGEEKNPPNPHANP
jgi:hypothetical protein